MKKLLLSITAVVAGYAAYAQVVVAGVSPAAIQGNYDYSVQANCGSWPGETDDGTWGVLSNLDFNVAGTYILDTLMLVEDGTPGLNAQGHPISQEGCDTLINDLTGKIAVIYRNTCNFTTKLLNAQNAGAIAAIIVNREDALLGMLGDNVEGIQVTIPAVFVSSVTGNALIAEMNNGPVTMFIGNKIGAFSEDIGAVKGEFMVSPYGGNNSMIFDGFDLGMQIYNYGLNDLPNATVQATIDGPNGNVYDQTLNIPLNSGDTAFIFPGNGTEFPAFNLGGVGNYDNGTYTLTYTIDAGATDLFPFDNVYTSEFMVSDDVLASSRVDGSNMPIANSYPSNNTIVSEYDACMVVQEPNIDGMIIDGLYMVPYADTAAGESIAGAEINANVYQWNDAWVDNTDPVFQTNNDPFQDLNIIAYGSHYPASDNEVEQPAWIQFNQPLTLQNDVRYLICLQTFGDGTNPIEVAFGYDNQNDNGANYSIIAQPYTPVQTDGTWYASGWVGGPSPSIALHQTHVGVVDPAILSGSAFPNPANDNVTVSVNANGDATLRIADVSGKIVFDAPVVLENGQASVNIAGFDAGVYVFNLTTAEGQTAVFNVVKK